MKVFPIDRGTRSFLVAPVFAAGWIGFTMPGIAATLSSDSTLALQISNFSHPAKVVGTEADVKTVALAGDSGEVAIKTAVDSLFVTDETTAFGYSISGSIVRGEGSNYLARKNVVSTLLGRFDIQADTDFRFEIEAYLSLWNLSNNSGEKSITNLGITSVFLQDTRTRNTINVFESIGSIDTGEFAPKNADFFQFRKNNRTNTLEYLSGTSFGGEEETIDFFLKASFQISVSRDTEFALFASTRSCVDTSKGGGICTVPEPSPALGLLAGAIGLSGFGLLREVMNRVVKFIF
ncbi:hypothetical protein V0288_20535 [Pannus brasiliensis CCIBt3594]|uniref:PEP-CTERM sorting domain-containing protein n=1 Tax=Pannus brasiliensis CCIBt3594 TaxID=1427578 RepID=A0AAW9QY11_9CHRO